MLRCSEPRKKLSELEAELAAKDILLKELGHRVKNSFAIIASLASLEASRASAFGCAGALDRIRGSVDAMALLYDRLGAEGAGGEIDAADYLGEIYGLMAGAIAPAELELDLEPLFLDRRRATALGLAANEATTNAIKYAFSGGRGGTLRVELRRDGDRARFAVEDDGPGFPPGFDAERDGDFGLDLLALEAGELGGTLRLNGGPGARVEIDFPA
jgi:two-component sensor histidine kinase